jgi:hypothetical protein
VRTHSVRVARNNANCVTTRGLLEIFATIRTSFSVAPENGASQSIKQMSRTLRVRNGGVTSVDYGSGAALFHRRADSGAGEQLLWDVLKHLKNLESRSLKEVE